MKLLFPFGPHLISIDEESQLFVFDIKAESQIIHIEFDKKMFDITTVCHPLTYKDKILVGSSQVIYIIISEVPASVRLQISVFVRMLYFVRMSGQYLSVCPYVFLSICCILSVCPNMAEQRTPKVAIFASYNYYAMVILIERKNK